MGRWTFIWRDNIFLHEADGAGKVNELIGMSMLSPSLPYQLTSQVSEEYKAAAAPFACVQAFRLRAILMIAELYKDFCLKHNPLSSLTKTHTVWSHTTTSCWSSSLQPCWQLADNVGPLTSSHTTIFTWAHGFTKKWLRACHQTHIYALRDWKAAPPGHYRLMPKGKIPVAIN